MKNYSSTAKKLRGAIPLVFCVLNAHSLYAQQDAKGCSDSPFITRFPGSSIEMCEAKDDDTQDFWVNGGKTKKNMEGKRNHVLYNLPETASKAQVTRNLFTALRQANWINDYLDEFAGAGTWHKNSTWLSISIGGGRYHVWSITLTTLTQDVTASAADLSKGIDATGHAVVPGILFDTAKADVKDESKSALDEVAKLLSENPKLRLYVVGHTDNVGTASSNMELSKRRSAAVVSVLVTKYHVAPARLDSFGAGPYAPVASNDTDGGRTQNRRVEIVKQ